MGSVVGCVWIEGLNLCRELGLKSGIRLTCTYLLCNLSRFQVLVPVPICGANVSCDSQRFSTLSHIVWVQTPPHSSSFHDHVQRGSLSQLSRPLYLVEDLFPVHLAHQRTIDIQFGYVLREYFATRWWASEGVSYMAWKYGESFASVGWFLREFRGAPHCSEQVFRLSIE